MGRTKELVVYLTMSPCLPVEQDTLLPSQYAKYCPYGLPARSWSPKDTSGFGCGAARRLLTGLASTEGKVQIHNTACNHLRYLPVNDFQYFTGNGLIPSWTWRACQHQFARFCSFVFGTHKLWECSNCNSLDSMRGLSPGGLQD